MNCDKCRELLSQYIDDRLDAAEALAVAAHLEVCGECRALERELRATVALLGGLEAKTPPIDLAQLVSARLERDMLIDAPADIQQHKRRVIRPIPFAGAGLAAAAVLLAAFYFLHAPVRKEPRGAAPLAPVADKVSYGTSVAGGADEADRRAAAPAQQELGKAEVAREHAAGGNEESLARENLKAAPPASTASVAHGNAAGVAENTVTSVPANVPRPLAAKEEKATVKGLQEDDVKRLRTLGYIGSEVPGAAEPAGAPKSDVAYSVGVPVQPNPVKPSPAAATAAAEGTPVAKTRKAIQPQGGVAGESEAIREVAGKDYEKRVPAPALASRDGNTELALQEPPIRTVEIASTDSAVTMAYELVKLLPAVKGKMLPQGAITVDMLRYAAFARGATVVEASDDRTVLEATLDPATLDGIRAALAAKAAPTGGRAGRMDLPAAKLGYGYSLQPTASRPAAGVAGTMPAPAQPAETPAKPAAATTASPINAAYKATDSIPVPAVAVKVRFTFERKAANAK